MLLLLVAMVVIESKNNDCEILSDVVVADASTPHLE